MEGFERRNQTGLHSKAPWQPSSQMATTSVRVQRCLKGSEKEAQEAIGVIWRIRWRLRDWNREWNQEIWCCES